jgi:hypothetical protein
MVVGEKYTKVRVNPNCDARCNRLP